MTTPLLRHWSYVFLAIDIGWGFFVSLKSRPCSTIVLSKLYAILDLCKAWQYKFFLWVQYFFVLCKCVKTLTTSLYLGSQFNNPSQLHLAYDYADFTEGNFKAPLQCYRLLSKIQHLVPMEYQVYSSPNIPHNNWIKWFLDKNHCCYCWSSIGVSEYTQVNLINIIPDDALVTSRHQGISRHDIDSGKTIPFLIFLYHYSVIYVVIKITFFLRSRQ